jgi:hypothetical protein
MARPDQPARALARQPSTSESAPPRPARVRPRRRGASRRALAAAAAPFSSLSGRALSERTMHSRSGSNAISETSAVTVRVPPAGRRSLVTMFASRAGLPPVAWSPLVAITGCRRAASDGFPHDSRARVRRILALTGTMGRGG